MKKIYLDNAATTYIDKSILKKICSHLVKFFGNPSSLHSLGREAAIEINKARKATADILGAKFEEIIFTGSGTESDNLAVFGVVKAYKEKGKRIIISKIEHKAVLESAKKLEKEGFIVNYLNVDSEGIINISEFKKLLKPDVVLISIMYANNEIGTIQPIKKISEIIKNFRQKNKTLFPFFHTDACQAAGALSLNVRDLGVDLMSLNGSKIYGPKGIGCLYKSEKIKLEPMIVGGNQENNFRAGTENAAFIIGFAESLKLAEKLRKKENIRLTHLRNYLINGILKKIKDSRLNGSIKKRLPNNINVSISGVEGESLILALDRYGIFASTGSACTSSDLTPSHVLAAIGLSPEVSHCSLRMTLGRKTTKKEIDYILKKIPAIVDNLRKISSVN